MATRAALVSTPKGVTEAGKRQSAIRIWLDERISKGRDKVFTERVTVTPELARIILEERNTNNRSIYPMKLAQIKSDMNGGRFKLNGQTISFAKSGELNDGQHRLKAIDETNKAQDMLIAFGIEREARTTVDIGRARTTADHLGIGGWPYAAIIAALSRRTIAYERSNHESLGRSGDISATEAVARATEDALIQEVGAFVGANAHKFRGLCSSGDVAFAFYQMSVKRPDQAKTFIEKLRDGSNLAEGNPIFAARQYLMLRPKLTGRDRIEILFRAWNYWIKDESVTTLRIRNSLPTLEA